MIASEHSSGANADLLDEVLAEYLKAAERGQAPARESLFVRYPDLATDLAEFFDGLDRFEGLASPLRAVRRGPSSPASSQESVSVGSTSQDAPTVTEAGPAAAQTVGHYRILGRLGKGGMGVVYKARQEPIGRLVALKMILAGHHAGSELRSRFHTEATAAARLEHPGVVRIYDFAEYDGLPYYTMELVDGESLHDRLRRGLLSPCEAAELVRKLAEAIDYAHRNNVLHRDLKPGNVLLARALPGHAEPWLPKVSDFGLAKLLDGEGEELTATNGVLGTALYMAPEQAEGQGGVGRPADIWALGVILYECLTGHVPFRGENRMRTLELVRLEEPLPPSRRQPEIPRALEAICLRCLEKSPGRRYPSAGTLAEDLGRWLEGEAPVGVPSWKERLWRRVGRAGKAVRQPAAVLCLALVALAGLAALFFSKPERRPTDGMALKQLQQDLDAGREVTLIEGNGEPAWYRWREGQADSVASLGTEDGAGTGRAFAIRTFTVAMVDLLPDPRCDGYRLSAQVRHTFSEKGGEAGVFVACQTHPRSPADVQFVTRVGFNDVRGRTEDQVLPSGKPAPPKDNVVQMQLRLYSDLRYETSIDKGLGGATGPPFKYAGPYKGDWHRIEVTVSPEGVTAQWDGKRPFSLSADAIKERIRTEMPRLRHGAPGDEFLQRLEPAFTPRGALGLYVMHGHASFRDVTVTPIVEKP